MRSRLPKAHELKNFAASAAGCLVGCFEMSPAKDWDFEAFSCADCLPRQSRELLQALLAELAFWRALTMPEESFSLPEWLRQQRPFVDSQLNLQQLLEYKAKAALAVFPVASRNHRQPWLQRAYLIEAEMEADSSKRIAREGWLPKSYALLLGGDLEENLQIDGDSWQLALQLAQKAISEPKLRLALGSVFACSGKVDREGTVLGVELGNKTELCSSSKRKWLLPEANQQQWLEKAGTHCKCLAVNSITAALTYVRESGVIAENFDFPKDIDELHLLLGASPAPTLALCMQIAPKSLCFWHSEQTLELAGNLKLLLQEHLHCEMLPLPSNNMPLAEQTLRERLETAKDKRLLLSITGGNRLMGYAAMLAARHCRVSMVYRDIDAEPDQLEMINFETGADAVPKNGKISGNNCPCELRELVNWDKLYKKPTQKIKTPELVELRRLLWKNQS